MPKPNKGESEKDFIGRCVGVVLGEGTTKDSSQAAAICHSIWRKHQQSKGVLEIIAEEGINDKQKKA